MNFKFNYGEIVQFEHPMFGVGKGVVVGCKEDGTEWIIYPKAKLRREDFPYMCFICKPEQLISTPF